MIEMKNVFDRINRLDIIEENISIFEVRNKNYVK